MLNSVVTTYCLHDSLTRKKNQAHIQLQGQAPFDIRLSIRNTRRGRPEIMEVSDIKQKKWQLDRPDYFFRETGSYEIKIISVADASGCDWEPPEDEDVVTHIDVVEPASIKAVDPKVDYCVGETLHYLLQGESQMLSTPRQA